MPILHLSAKDTYNSVVRPTVKDVMSQVRRYTGLSSDIDVQFNNERNIGTDNREEVAFGHDDQLKIRATTLFTEKELLSDTTRQTEELPLFHDPLLGVSVTPIYGQVRVEIEVEFRHRNRTAAEEWLNGVKHRTMKGSIDNQHHISYYYFIPDRVMATLLEVYTLRETQAGYGDTLTEYFQKGFQKEVTKLTDLSGGNGKAAVRETQGGLSGRFSWEGVPEQQKGDGDGGMWNTSFTYRMEFKRITGFLMKYPIMIHNQPMGDDYVNYDVNPQYALEEFLTSMTLEGIQELLPSSQAMSTVHGWGIPAFDEWYPTKTLYALSPIARVMIGVDPTDPTLVTNINDPDEMGGCEWHPLVLEYLKEKSDWLPLYGMGPINVRLYEDEEFRGDDFLTVETDLTVRTTETMDVRKRYHLVIFMLMDWTRLKEPAKEYMLDNGDLSKHLLDGLLYGTGYPVPNTIETQNRPRMPRKNFWNAVAQVPFSRDSYLKNLNLNRMTVATSSIIAHSE